MTVRGYQGVDCASTHVEFASFDRVTTEVPAKGATSLFVGAKMPPLGLCWLGSATVMEGSADKFCPDGELVRIRLRRNGRIYFDRPLARTWHGPAVIPLGAPILEDVQLIGGKGSIHVGLVNNLLIKDWTVDSYSEARGISVQSCRDVQIENCQIDSPAGVGPGAGYGIQLQRTTGFVVKGVSGKGNRHLVTLFGSASGKVADCVSRDGKGTSFDCHGFGEEDCEFESCDSGNTDFSCGNKWSWGAHGILVRRMTNTKVCWAHGTSSLDVFDSAFQGPLGLTQNAWGPPRRVRAFNSSFRAFSTTKWLHLQGGDDFDLTQVEFDIATLVASGPYVAAV